MRSDASSVNEYIAGAPDERRDALNLLRRLCCEELSGFDEAIRHGTPAYVRDDMVEVSFASQKNYISLYTDQLGGLSVGKSCIRFRRLEQIDPTTVRALLRATVTDTGPIC